MYNFDITRVPISLFREFALIEFKNPDVSIHILGFTLFRIHVLAQAYENLIISSSSSFNGPLPTDFVVMGSGKGREGRQCIDNVRVWSAGQNCGDDFLSALTSLLDECSIIFEYDLITKVHEKILNYSVIIKDFCVLPVGTLGLDLWIKKKHFLQLESKVTGYGHPVSLKGTSKGMSHFDHPLCQSLIQESEGTEERWLEDIISLANSSCTEHATLEYVSSGDMVFTWAFTNNLNPDLKDDEVIPVTVHYRVLGARMECTICMIITLFWRKRRIFLSKKESRRSQRPPKQQ